MIGLTATDLLGLVALWVTFIGIFAFSMVVDRCYEIDEGRRGKSPRAIVLHSVFWPLFLLFSFIRIVFNMLVYDSFKKPEKPQENKNG